MRRHAGLLAVGDPEPVAEVDGHLGGAVLVHVGAERDDDRAAAARLRRGPRAGVAGERDAVDGTRRRGDAFDRGRALPGVRAGRGDEHGRELRPRDAGEPAERLGDLGGLRAGHVEPAAGEVLGLPGGERDGGDDDGGPGDQDEAPAAAQHAVEAQHGGLHSLTPGDLAGWPAKDTARADGRVCGRAHTAGASAHHWTVIDPDMKGPCTVQM